MESSSDILKQVRRIEIKTRGLSNDIFAGKYHSAFKGRGMAFSEVREYRVGDDVRDIDWNVTARIGNASVKLISALESAGVNQTCHTIRAEVTAEIQAAIPFSQTTAQVHYSCLITETVIVGSVPESYLEFSGM